MAYSDSMRRKIRREVSRETRQYQSAPACQRYQELKAELMRLDDIWAEHVVAFGCRDELTADTRFNQAAAALCETYEGLDAQHKAAVDETNAVDLANTLIAETIAHIWQAKRLPDNIHDVTAEVQFIEVMKLKPTNLTKVLLIFRILSLH